MPWRFTDQVEVFADRVWGLLADRPAHQSVPLTVIESVRDGRRWSEDPLLFGWHEDRAGVRGAVFQTPPHPLLLAAVPAETVSELVSGLRGRRVSLPGVHGDPAAVECFAAEWTAGTRLRQAVTKELRLYGLAALRPPAPPPAGRPRPARREDLATATDWIGDFQVQADEPAIDPQAMAAEQIGGGRLWLWEDPAGRAVSLAGRTATAAGVARIAPVYTPPEHRRRGYGAAVTAACTADAVRRGAGEVVLFADLANQTSNSIYQQIGYRALGDRRIVSFEG